MGNKGKPKGIKVGGKKWLRKIPVRNGAK